MKKFIDIFNRVNGKEILRQYRKGNVLLYALLMAVLLGFDKKSLEILRLAVNNKLLKRFRKKYKAFVKTFKKKKEIQCFDRKETIYTDEYNKKIWLCWFQGMENAPEIVKSCYKSLQYYAKREIIVITEENYINYVQFPDFIQKKIERTIISKTHMSDLLRLELLRKYGGTWVDATVFFTDTVPDYMLESDLFLFQNLKPGLDGHCISVSSWFITAVPGNLIIELTLELLYEYWRRNDKLVDYFIIHHFFQIAIEEYPDIWKKVLPVNNATPHILLLKLFDEYDERIWEGIKEQTAIHKLTHKYNREKEMLEGTFYDVLLNRRRG